MGATPPRLLHWSSGNYEYLFYLVWRCACGFEITYHYLFSTFCTFSFFFSSYDTMTRVACGRNFIRFMPNFLKLCRCLFHGLKMYICFWGYPPIIFITIFFYFFDTVFQIRLVSEWYLVDTAHRIVFHQSFLNYAYLFYMVWKCACGFGVKLPVFFINFFHFVWLNFFQVQLVFE